MAVTGLPALSCITAQTNLLFFGVLLLTCGSSIVCMGLRDFSAMPCSRVFESTCRLCTRNTWQDAWYKFEDDEVTPFNPQDIEANCFGGTTLTTTVRAHTCSYTEIIRVAPCLR